MLNFWTVGARGLLFVYGWFEFNLSAFATRVTLNKILLFGMFKIFI